LEGWEFLIWIYLEEHCALDGYGWSGLILKDRGSARLPFAMQLTVNYSGLELLKPIKLPPKEIFKNHSKSQKNYKMNNPIVLESK
jgi:hypothetical protein